MRARRWMKARRADQTFHTGPDQQAPNVPSLDRQWCGREDSNFHVLSDTTTSTLRVYQFRHDRT